MGLDSVHLSIS